MQRKQAITAGLLAGAAAIGLIAYSQRSTDPAEERTALVPEAAVEQVPPGPDPAAIAAEIEARHAAETDALLALLAEGESELTRLAGEIAGRDDRIAALTEALATSETTIGTLTSEVEELRGQSGPAAVLAERDAQLEALTATLAEREASIERMQAELANLRSDGNLARTAIDTRVATLTATLAERDAAIDVLQVQIGALANGADLAPVLAERDERILDLTAALGEREATIGGLQDEIASLRRDLTVALAERDDRIGMLTATLAGRDAVVERLQAEAEALRGGTDLGDALTALEAESNRRIATLTATLTERDATIAALQSDIEALRGGTDLAPAMAAVEAEGDKPVLSFSDQVVEIARLSAMLDAVKLGPEVMTVALASPAPALRMVPALRPAGEAGPLAEVHFEMGSARLSPGGLARAAAAAVTLAEMPLERIRLVGYADRTGSPARNRALAERRAEAVAAFLIANGLPADRIETEGMVDAADLPVATGPGVSEPLNRSVAIIPVPLPTG